MKHIFPDCPKWYQSVSDFYFLFFSSRYFCASFATITSVTPNHEDEPVVDQSSTSLNLNHVSNLQNSADESLNPYFLHHNDTTNLVLVIELLTYENYISWSRSMIIALFVKNKLGFIDGSITCPTGELLPAWIRNSHVVIAWILNSVSKPISASIIFSECARDIWFDRFEKKNGPRIFQLKRDLSTFSQNQDSVNMYFTRLKTIWDEYSVYRPSCTFGRCTCSGMHQMTECAQFEYLMSFLMGLNDSFVQVRA